jgi:hypothetical protein
MIYWNQRMVIIGMVLIAILLIVISAIVSPQGDELLEKKASLSYSIMSEPSRLFNVDQEANIPTWFTASIALYTALVASLIASSMKSQGKKFAGWRGLACLFLYIALDEVGGLHELLIDPLRNAFGLTGWLYQSWVIVGLAIALIVGLAYIQFLFRLPRGIGFYLISGGMIYVFGVIGVEAIGGLVLSTEGLTNWYVQLAHIEEFLEMMGLILALYALSEFARRELKSMTIVLK